MLRPALEEIHRDGLRLLMDPNAMSDGLLVAFTDRNGGVSEAPYDSLNLGDHVGDDPQNVGANLARAASALGLDAGSIARARQVHGSDVIEVEPGMRGVVGACDVLVTRLPGPTLAVFTADCTPVVIAGRDALVTVHAGWRGLVGGAVEAGVAVAGEGAVAWVGPSIHACCYQVGPEVIDAFRGAGLPVADAEHVDPGRAAAFALHRAGVERVAASTDCTSCDRRYFSYRRDGVTGRQAAVAAKLR